MLIQQRRSNDCLLCASAMFYGLTYDEVLDLVKRKCSEYYTEYKNNRPLPMSLSKRLALTFGIKNIDWMEPAQFNYNKAAILAVPALQQGKPMHCVYWDTNNIYDPSIDTRYTEFPNTILHVFQKY